MFQKISTALLVLFLAVSCGGGGGSSSSSGSSSGGGSSSSSSSSGGSGIVFTPDRGTINFSYDESAFSMPEEAVTVTASGTFTGTLYIAATVEGMGIDPNIQTEISGTQAIFHIKARSGLATGTYTGRVSLLGCSDANCSKQIGNSPVNINYTLLVRATLKTTPETVSATSASGSITSHVVAVRVPTGSTTYQATISWGSDFISLDQETATGFRINLRSLPPGNYSGSILVTSGTQQVNLIVGYIVGPGVPYNTMSLSPQGFSLTAHEGAVNAPVMLNVTPPSWDPVTTARFTSPTVTTPAWLRSTPATGGYSLVVDATDLTAGAYTGSVFVAGAWPQQELQIPVALTVGPGMQRPADVIKTIESDTPVASLTGTTPVNVVEGPPVGWTASVNVPWLHLTDASGTTGETLAYQIDSQLLAALPNGAEHVARVTITPQRATMSPTSYDIHVNKRLAAVMNVGPYVQTANRPTRVILRGFGFAGIANLQSRLQFTGATVNSITRVNDTEVIVNLGPVPVGSYPFSFSNALGIAASSARLLTIAATSQGYASMPTGGDLRGLFYDPERATVYAVNVGLESLQRFRRGAQWETSSLPVPAILSAGLTQDGSRLLLASSATGVSRIRQLDPMDMNVELASTNITQELYRGFTYLTGVISTTNDGRNWFSVGSTWNELAYFDAGARVMNVVHPTVQTSFYGGPWFIASRDGERLIIPQSGSISPSPPQLYLDAADSEIHINPAGLLFTYRMSISDDGDRFLYDNYEIRDRNFALIGRMPAFPRLGTEPLYYARASQLSPDGTRVYVVAYPDSFAYEGYPLRVFVLDSSTRQIANDELPILGYHDFTEFPTCRDSQTNYNCYGVIHTAISPDGMNLYVGGDVKLLVLPASGLALTPVSATLPPRVNKQGRAATTPWRLDIRN